MRTPLAILLTLTFAVGARPASAQQFLLHGKMVTTHVEGGCWYLDVAGKHYEFIGDSGAVASTHIEGAYVTVLVEAAKGAMSACMVGEVVKLIEVQQSERHPVDMMIADMDIRGKMRKAPDGRWYVVTAKNAKFLLTHPAACYKHNGAKYHRFSRVVHGPDREEYVGTIIGDARKPAPPAPAK